MTRRPDLFIIGAPKSGTTSLYEYLAGHPEVHLSPVKEPFYFSPDIRGGPRQNYRYGHDEQRYLRLFAEARDEKRVGEASTRYVYSRRAPALIKAFAPEARIVVMLRNPVDMIHAMHNERVSHGEEDVEDFETALALDDDRLAGRHLPAGSNELGATYRPRARFGEQLARWLEHFDRRRVKTIILEEFSADPPNQFRELLEFLEIDPNYQPSSFTVHNSSHRRREGVIRALVTSRAGQWAAHRLMPGVLGEARAARMIRRFRHSRFNRRPNPRPPLPPELRRELEAELAPDVALLSSLLGRDLRAQWFGSR